MAQFLTWGMSEAAALRLTQSEAIEWALRENKGLAAARLTIEQVEARSQQAGKWANPELKLSYASDRAFYNEGETAFELGFEQRFPITNRLKLLKGIASVEIELAQVEIRNVERLLAEQVALAFVDIAHLEAQIGLRRSLIELHEESAAFIESRIERGEASSMHLNQLNIELYAVEQSMQQLENERLVHLSALRQLLGVEVGLPLEIEFDLSLPESAEGLSVFTEAMLEGHPEYELKQLLYTIADKRSSLALAERWEDIAVELFFNEERGMDAPNGLGRNRFLGVSISIPLPLINRNQGAIIESHARRRQVNEELKATSLELRSLAERWRERAVRLFAQAVEYEKKVTQAVEQNLKEMTHAYGAGQVSLTELFRSQEQRLKLESYYLTMLHDYAQAKVRWNAATARNINE